MIITLTEAVSSAFNKTQDLPIAESRLQQTNAKVEQIQARFFPALSFGANYLLQDSINKNLSYAPPQSYTRFTIAQSVYEGGKDSSALNATQMDKEVQKQNVLMTNNTIFKNVARVFYGVLSNEWDLENLNKTIALSHDRIDEMKKFIRIGRTRSIELTTAQAQLSILESQKSAAEGQLFLARDQFALFTGLPKDVKIQEKQQQPDHPGKIDKYLSYIQQRPDIKALKAQIQSIQSTIEMNRASYFPSIVLGGNYYLTREGSLKGNNWDAGVTLNLPLYSGGLVNAQIREITEKKKEAEYILQQMERQAELSIRSSYHNLISSLKQIKSLESAFKVTEGNYKEQEKNYKFGQATNLDVIQALNTLQDTKRTLDHTRSLAHYSWAELQSECSQISSVITVDKESDS